ncbi:MAG: septum formation protein Maf [Planctomycetota bacterium]|nr:MAG: septum formation protein Maf [Planctomycetota bacterium]
MTTRQPWQPERLILASGSPRRRQLLEEAGYRFEIVTPSESAECGLCSGEAPWELVARLALAKARDVAARVPHGCILACDTVAECCGRILGKPADRDHAEEILRFLSGRRHRVLSGVCLWDRPHRDPWVEVDVTELFMEPLSDAQLAEYLDSGLWEGKAGAFGYQDRLGWVRVVRGSESNVVGLPMERLADMFARLRAEREGGGPH